MGGHLAPASASPSVAPRPLFVLEPFKDEVLVNVIVGGMRDVPGMCAIPAVGPLLPRRVGGEYLGPGLWSWPVGSSSAGGEGLVVAAGAPGARVGMAPVPLSGA